MPIRHLHDCPARPWKNGLGRTRELAVAPHGAGMDDFLWRASIAEVDSAAPFSTFAGVERTIVLLDGAGFTMTLGDGRSHALTTPYAPFAFPGELQVAVTMAGGATRDFNLMLRRGRAHGGVTVWRDQDRPAIPAQLVLLYAAEGQVIVDDHRLDPGDAWVRHDAPPTHVVLEPGAVALAVCAGDAYAAMTALG